MIDLEQARKLGEAATSASWEATHDTHEQERADCDFIAYARNHWTELLDELETLRKVARRSPISPLAHVDLVISQLRDGL